MKIFVFSDIHGNKYVLDKITSNQDYQNSDLKICLGDYITVGPHTNEVVDWIENNPEIIFLLGNNDSYVVNGLTEEELSSKSDAKLNHLKDVLNELSQENIEFLKSLQKEYVVNSNNHKILFCHYGWESETEVFEEPTEHKRNSELVTKAFKNKDFDYIFFGHVHSPFDLKADNKNFICVGSVGSLYEAQYVIIDITNDSISVIRKTLDFDIESFKKDMANCSDPSRQFFSETIDDVMDKKFIF